MDLGKVRHRRTAFRYARLPAPTRRDFDREDRERRRGQALWGMGLGLLCYLGLLGIDWFVVPDVLALDAALRIAVGLPIGLVAIWVLTRADLPAIVHEAAPALYGLACAVTIAFAMSRSAEPAALSYFCAGLVVICFTINLVGMNPPMAAATCLTISVTMAAFSAVSRFGTPGVFVTNLVFGTMVCGVATFANWSLLNQRRQAFLLRKRDERRLAQIARQRDVLVRLATVDPLTDLPNRRGFEALVAADLAATPTGTPMAAVMIDIDCFKAFNDDYGHPGGDAALRTVAEALKQACGGNARVGRFGGEEFGIVVFGPDADDLSGLGRRLCGAVEALARPHAWSDVASVVTVSAGIAAGTVKVGQSNCADLFGLADRALYQAKRAGRNRAAVTLDAHGPRGGTPIAASRGPKDFKRRRRKLPTVPPVGADHVPETSPPWSVGSPEPHSGGDGRPGATHGPTIPLIDHGATPRTPRMKGIPSARAPRRFGGRGMANIPVANAPGPGRIAVGPRSRFVQDLPVGESLTWHGPGWTRGIRNRDTTGSVSLAVMTHHGSATTHDPMMPSLSPASTGLSRRRGA